MAEQATDARVTPFARMFMLPLKRGERLWQMAFQTIFARLHGQMLRRLQWERLGAIFSREIIKTTDDGQNDGDKDQVA